MSDILNTKEIMSTLAKLGGAAPTADQAVQYEGNRFTVPERHRGNLMAAAKELAEVHKSLEERDRFQKNFNFHPFDGAYMFALACKRLFGFLPQQSPPGFFSPGGTTITVNVSPTETVDVPWGEFELPFLEASVILMGNPVNGFVMRVEAPKKYAAEVHGLFAAIQELWNSESIYRGNTIDAEEVPNIIDVASFEARSVVYTRDVESQLEANIFSPLMYTEVLRRKKQPLKRAILLEGDYGNGKTLAGLLTAKVAKENGWTYIACKPGEGQDPFTILKMARNYQPAVVFVEDVDTIAGTSDPDAVSRLLDEFDGIKAKNTELFVVMTTNHADKIHKGMLRPGRLDAVVHIGNPDRESVERLVQTLAGEHLSKDVDYDKVWEAVRGFQTAFVKEALDRAVRYLIARTNGLMNDKLSTDDLVNAANGLRPHLELMDRANESQAADPISKTLVDTIRAAMDGVLVGEAGYMDTDDRSHMYNGESDPANRVIYPRSE